MRSKNKTKGSSCVFFLFMVRFECVELWITVIFYILFLYIYISRDYLVR